jgi:DNA polymerase-3 subunit alpha
VIDYVANKYGHDRVAQIITFGTMGAKASIRDVGRAMGWAYGDVDRIARLIPQALNITIDKALVESAELRQTYDQDARARDLIDRAKQLEGISRHAGTHAAGVVISADPLVDHLALQRPSRQEEGALPTTQFTMENVAEIGLLKMDFLGLANLTILGEAVEIIRERRGIEMDPKHLPQDDLKTFEMLANGETFGVFQLESAGMRRYIRELRPESVAELSAMVALYRPGPMQHIPTYCRAKHGLEPIRYPHQDLAETLDETYGVIVYQDQVLLIAQKFAGYTLGEADIMRKAMGKKIAEKMAAERQRFISGAGAKGYSKQDAETIFNLIEPFAGYAFNKAHATCYGTISYQTAYLKANYAAEYMTAVFRLASSHPSGTATRVAAAAAECAKLGIAVLPPDINRSQIDFIVEELEEGKEGIRFGLSTVKNVGEGAVAAVIAARDSLPDRRFASFEQFCDAVDWSSVNRRVAESLIKCGALDELGARGSLLEQLDSGISAAQSRQKATKRGQVDMFSTMQIDAPSTVAVAADEVVLPQKTLLAWEKELLGFYLSSHPLRDFMPLIRERGYVQLAEIDEETVGQQIESIVLITGIRRLNTKSNRTMAVCQLEDQSGSIEAVFFPELFESSAGSLLEDAIVRISAKVDNRNDRVQLVASGVNPVSNEKPAPVRIREIQLRMPSSPSVDDDIQRMHRIRELFDEFPGDDRVMIHLHSGERLSRLAAGICVDWCEDVALALAEIVGADAFDLTERDEIPTPNRRLLSA